MKLIPKVLDLHNVDHQDITEVTCSTNIRTVKNSVNLLHRKKIEGDRKLEPSKASSVVSHGAIVIVVVGIIIIIIIIVVIIVIIIVVIIIVTTATVTATIITITSAATVAAVWCLHDVC